MDPTATPRRPTPPSPLATASRRRWLAGAAAAAGAGLLAACGGGADRTKAQVRLVNASGSSASGYTALDLREDGAIRQGPVGYGATAGYAEIDPDLDNATIHAAGSATALLTFRPSLSKNQYYTLLAIGNAGSLRQLLLDDNRGRPADSRIALRVVNAAPDAGSLDVYLTGNADTLQASVPSQAAAAYGVIGAWLDAAPGTWRLRVAAADSKTDVRLDLSGLVLNNRDIVTLVLTPSRGGVLVNALVLVQQGGIGVASGTQARVRAAAAVEQGGTVAARIGNTALLGSGGGFNSPLIGDYALVDASQTAATVTVNGAAVTVPALALAAGSDYTLLVYGAPGAPQTSLIEDDNRLPTSTNRARLRLVNAVAGLGSPLALTVDASPVADGVAAGTGSAYALATPSTTAVLSATATGVPTPIAELTAQTLLADSVYTAFVVADGGGRSMRLRKDR